MNNLSSLMSHFRVRLPNFFDNHSVSIDMRLCMQVALIVLHTRLQSKLKTNDRVKSYARITASFFLILDMLLAGQLALQE